MKSTVLTLVLGVSLTLGATVTSHADTLRIPQGRGQALTVQIARPTTVALYVKDAVCTSKPHPVAPRHAH